MNNSLRQNLSRGFTLIELLIVVIIIAILAAIAIPQFSNTAGDAQESALDANLNTMRSAIELYRIQHNNTLPTRTTAVSAAACTGVSGTGLVNTPQAFTDQMTMFSNAAGQTCTIGAPASVGYTFGPYLRAIPNDSISAAANNAVVITQLGAAAPNPAAANGGWTFDNVSGRLQVNSNADDRNGRDFFLR